MNIMILGYSQHGKGTLSKLLNEFGGITSQSSSKFYLDLFLFEKLKSKFGYKTKEDAYADRQDKKVFWFNEIKAFCHQNGLHYGGSLLLEQYDAYDGCRNIEEFDAIIDNVDIDLTVWVDASDRIPPQGSDSMTITKDSADIILYNNGSEEEFYQLAYEFYNQHIKPLQS